MAEFTLSSREGIAVMGPADRCCACRMTRRSTGSLTTGWRPATRPSSVRVRHAAGTGLRSRSGFRRGSLATQRRRARFWARWRGGWIASLARRGAPGDAADGRAFCLWARRSSSRSARRFRQGALSLFFRYARRSRPKRGSAAHYFEAYGEPSPPWALGRGVRPSPIGRGFR